MNKLDEGFLLGEWEVYPLTGVLSRNGQQSHAEPKVMDLLMALIKSPEQFGYREQLLADVWPDVVVNEEVLTRAISELRTALGDTSRHRRYIMTIPKRGYKLLAIPQALPDKHKSTLTSPRLFLKRWSALRVLGTFAQQLAMITGYLFLGSNAWLYWVSDSDQVDKQYLENKAIAQWLLNCDTGPVNEAGSKIKPA